MSDERKDPTGSKAPSVVSQNYSSSMSYKEILGSIERDFSPKKSSMAAVNVARPKIIHRVQFIDFPLDEDPEPLSMLSASRLQVDPREIVAPIEDEMANQRSRELMFNPREEEKVPEALSTIEQQIDFPLSEQGEEPSGIKAPTVVSENVTASSFRQLLGSIESEFSPKKSQYYDAAPDESLRRSPNVQFINIPINQGPEPLSQISISGAPFSQLDNTSLDEGDRSQFSLPWDQDQDEESPQTNHFVQTVDVPIDREPDPLSQISITGALPENQSILSSESECESAPPRHFFPENCSVENDKKKQSCKCNMRVLLWILATTLLSSLLAGFFFAGYCARGSCIQKDSASQASPTVSSTLPPFSISKPSSKVPTVSKYPDEFFPGTTTTPTKPTASEYATIGTESPDYQIENKPTAPPTTMAYRTNEIVEYINRIRLFPYPIEYPPKSNTPEEYALKWLIEIDPLQLTLSDRFRLVQRYALQTLIFSSPYSDPSKSAISVEECDWFGVRCTKGVVTSIDFQYSLLQFSIPHDLGLLISLQSINLQSTGLKGTIPESIGKLEGLLYLNVAENQLSGNIPTNLAGCSSLWKAEFYSNALTGSVPSAICELDEIYEIIVDCTVECACCQCL
jgi:hypothetical protein